MRLSESINLVNTILNGPRSVDFTQWLIKGRGWDAQIQALANAPTDQASNERYALWMEQQYHIFATMPVNQKSLPPVIENKENSKRLSASFREYLDKYKTI